MKTGRSLFMSLLLALGLWLVFSWPLPNHLFTGIPTSSTNIEKGGVRRMMAGDHLQLHYFYWLFSDMVAGRTPWFHNVYEFNTGDDAARRRVGPYNMPFSLVFALANPVGGRAFAWNVTGFATLWLSLWLTFLLLRRLRCEDGLALLTAAAALAFPYRWMTLLGGSPTGFAMLWVPLLALGMHRAARDGSAIGGLLAASALALSYVNDRHIFLFGALSLPLWFLAGLLGRGSLPWRRGSFWLSLLRGAAPIVLAAAALGFVAWRAKHATFAGTVMEGGRATTEVEIFSPAPRGLLAWQENGTDAHGYVGYLLPLLLALHAGLLLRRLARHPHRAARSLALPGLLWAAMALCVLVMLGPKGPLDGAVFTLARKVVPGFTMIRQTDKVFCLFPTLLALALALALPDLSAWCASARRRSALAGGLAVLLAVEYAFQVRATVCILDDTQPAYAAVAADARRQGAEPRAMILPLWPGDSAWASLYEHYVSLYRIRMINGYTPVVPRRYKENVFRRLSSANVGQLSDEQFAALAGMGVRYVILHENAFPEKVSPFPVYFTLRRLLTHPRMELLRQGGDVWAFRILDAPRPPPDLPAFGPMFPSRYKIWECEGTPATNATAVADDTASHGGALTLDREGATLYGDGFRHCGAPQAVLKVRVKGTGEVAVSLGAQAESRVTVLAHSSTNWVWRDVALDGVPDPVRPRFEWRSGTVALDLMLLSAGPWRSPLPGETLRMPACLFFNAGVIDPHSGRLRFRADYEADSLILFGPRLPLEPGRYALSLDFDTDAAPGTRMGTLVVRSGQKQLGRHRVLAGRPDALLFTQERDLPFTLEFSYERGSDMVVAAALLRRVR